MAEQSYFMGQDGFIWFVGVVEDRNDPEPWASSCACLDFIQKIRMTYHQQICRGLMLCILYRPIDARNGKHTFFLVEGSWVIGFFRDTRKTTTCNY